MSNAFAAQLDRLIGEAVAALREGLIVAYPTETFYGLAADPFSRAAMERLLALKGREAAKTVALIAADAESAFALASAIPPFALKLADRFWPGPLTLVMPARGGLNQALVGPDSGVGVRVSPHPIARALAAGFGRPITATSANLAGQPPASTIAMARVAFGSGVSVYLDGGVLEAASPSTVVACDASGWRIIRTGAISADQIAAVLAAREER
ncbi:MAG: L-threonylcarbamoyladenylate synthase [Candidatus Binataceae bacterium]|jgi:L-threonylcarbamoyladenylate synthase